jgi:hypothetical protein
MTAKTYDGNNSRNKNDSNDNNSRNKNDNATPLWLV